MSLESQDRLIEAEENVAAVMLHVEAGELEQARHAVNVIADGDDGKTRLAWALLRATDMLHRQEVANERLLGRRSA